MTPIKRVNITRAPGPKILRAGDAALAVVAAPAAALYGCVVLARRFAYDQGILQGAAAPLFTVSVGALEAGGTGKTPIAGLLLGALIRAGRRPGLVTRGYRRRTRGLVLRHVGEVPVPGRIGDEPAMLVKSGLDVPVAAVSDRRLGVCALAKQGCGAAVLDDAFVHRRLLRDVDIVVLRDEYPFGDAHLLPWGSLREPPSSLRRATLVWLHRRDGRVPSATPPVWAQQLCPQAGFVFSRSMAGRAIDAGSRGVDLAGVRVVGAAGIARPAEFHQSLHDRGAEVVAFKALRDHHEFSAADVRTLVDRAALERAMAVVVTPKDAIKLHTLWPHGEVPLWTVSPGVQIVGGREVLADSVGVSTDDLLSAEGT